MEAERKALREEFAAKLVNLEARAGCQKREFAVLQAEVGLERGLEKLHKEIARARSEIPNFSALEEKFDVRQADLEGKHARLERELAKTKEWLSKARVDQSIANYTLAELEKQVKASSEASISMEFESRHSHFEMKAAHPAAAKALKEWVAQIINGQQDGTIWLPGPAGNA